MSNIRRTVPDAPPARWYRGSAIPKRVIRRFARQVAEQFQPEKIILFGSYAYGTPHDDSDVDILVVMPARNQLDQAVRISLAIDPPFPLDIIVRTPYSMRWRLAEGDSFLREITSKGEVLYEAPEPAHELTPEKLYERRWVTILLDQVLERLHGELEAEGKGNHFDELKLALLGEAAAAGYERAGEALGLSPAAAKQAAYRMRKRYRELLREEVARTVAGDDKIDDEIGRLFECLSD